MGMTPLEGLVMGTRSGDVDPGMFTYLARELGLSVEEIERQLYSNSGLKALAGSHDLREVEQKAAEGDADAQLAINVYAYRVRKYIGAYAAAMGGVDVIAFTGGIGENSASMRRRVCDKFEFLGLHLDDDKNQAVKLKGFEAPQVQSFDSRIKVIVTQTCEQLMIAQEVKYLMAQHDNLQEQKWHIPVAVSARHVHLSQEAVEALFGKGHQLKKMRSLSQTEGWAAEESVEVIGPKGSFKTVRVLGPTRTQTQIEVSKTDTFTLGVEAPVRPSGKLEGTPRIKLRGTAGEIETNGLIIAARHIHMSPQDAAKMGVKNGDYVDVKLGDGDRSVSFANTLIRVKEGYVTEMHIDTDEANAAGIAFQTKGELVMNETRGEADIVAKKNMELNGRKAA
jgi:acetate kinase